jgi:uncharacterized Zn finger protein (UPF0148 family)
VAREEIAVVNQESRSIVCGECRAAVEGRIADGGNGMVACPVCNRTDTFENAAREAAQHGADKAARKLLSSLEAMTFKDVPQRNYLWHFD